MERGGPLTQGSAQQPDPAHSMELCLPVFLLQKAYVNPQRSFQHFPFQGHLPREAFPKHSAQALPPPLKLLFFVPLFLSNIFHKHCRRLGGEC